MTVADMSISKILPYPGPSLGDQEEYTVFFQTCTRPFFNNLKCCLNNSTSSVHKVSHRNPLFLMANWRKLFQFLLSVVIVGFFSHQGFRDAYRMPTIQEGHAQCNQTLPTLKDKIWLSFTNILTAQLSCNSALPLIVKVLPVSYQQVRPESDSR